MQVKSRQLLFKLSIWIATEIILGYVGLDDLADYSEYLKEQVVNSQLVMSTTARVPS